VPKIADEARTARRDQIIAAAAECFARAGYHVTTMADIAETAGVSKGTPYLYFPGKEALFIALYEEWDCGLAARVDAAIGGLAEPPAASHLHTRTMRPCCLMPGLRQRAGRGRPDRRDSGNHDDTAR